MPSQRVIDLYRSIAQLPTDELNDLLAMFKDLLDEGDEEGGLGVREPRRPLPPSDEGHALPEDYWETAQ